MRLWKKLKKFCKYLTNHHKMITKAFCHRNQKQIKNYNLQKEFKFIKKRPGHFLLNLHLIFMKMIRYGN